MNDRSGKGVWFDPSQIVTVREGQEYTYAKLRDGNYLEFSMPPIEFVSRLEAAGVLVYDAMEDHPF